MNFRKILIVVLIIMISANLVLFIRERLDPGSEPSQRTPQTRQNGQNPTDEPVFDKAKYSLTDPDSPWVIINKQRPLQPNDYRPSDLVVPDVRLRVPGHETMQLRAEAASALEELFASAEADGLPLMLSSAFRSYSYQVNLYNSYVNSQGREAADKTSARPGHSEHQTGLAADIRPTNGKCELEQCFGDMPEGKWIAANAHMFGFIIRYSKTNETEAGYSYEPWHLRYVGKELAGEYIRTQATSLEAFFRIEFAPDYKD